MIMEINSLIDPTNEKLYQSVCAHLSLRLEENQDWRESVWGSAMDGDAAVITYSETDLPKAAFTHELLHLETQIKGYKRIFSGVSLRKDVQSYIPTLIKVLDTDFQHHKMAHPFLEMGYPSAQFYNDDESDPVRYLNDELSKEGHTVLYLSTLYMVFKSPLSGVTTEESFAIQQAFETYANGIHKPNFERIDEIIQNWIQEESYDAERYMIDFLQNAGITQTWISYKKDIAGMFEKNFPDSGFFIGEPFTLTEIEEVYG